MPASGLLHDPVSGTSPRVELVRDPAGSGGMVVRGPGVDRLVPGAALSLEGGGWQDDAAHLVWEEEGRRFAVTVQGVAALQALGAELPAPLLATLLGLQRRTERAGRRGWRTAGIVTFVFVGIPVLILLTLFLMRDRLVEAALRRLPTSVDAQLGDLMFQQVTSSGQVLEDGPAQRAVQALGTRLVAASPGQPYAFRFAVLRDASVNAFAAPGGVVVVHTGLLAAARNPDELAGVLAHEVTHVLNRHSMRQVVYQAGLSGAVRLLVGSPSGAAGVLTGAASDLTSLGFSRDQERDADRGGLDLLQRAQLPAEGMVRFFEELGKAGGTPPAIVSSHPPSSERREALRAEIARRGAWPVTPADIDWAAVQAENTARAK